jgi:hypothetical protein
METIKLGQKCRDVITGFEGTVVARCEWISGCTRITLQPRVDKDGKLQDMQTFDEPGLEVIANTNSVNPTPNKGGPRPGPARAEAPK